MLLPDFKRILTAFADNEADLDISKGVLIVQVRDELIEAKLLQQGGELIIDEQGQRLTAVNWLVNRVARVSLLADRILSYVPEAPGFVTPSGRLLDQPDFSRGSEDSAHQDAEQCGLEVLGRRPAGTTSVLYLTSDAGEGKTTLINHMARMQANAFKSKRSDWLLVPIPLGGRTFLRFDDVVVAALVNRLRFQLLYYDAFIELVRLGVLVPAFDGFEEMMIASSSGEAISALANLVRSLKSSGTALVAARKAYFDYQSFKSQARLFDSVGTDSVAFARLSLDRWNEDQFITYGHNRGLSDPKATYDDVSKRLSKEHPLLTRAVLVRRLVDVATQSSTLDGLLDQIGNAPQHYFFQFVSALIEREAQEKWLDLSGDMHQQLLTVEEHHELLSMVAQEMWVSSTDALKPDVLAAIAEVFAELHGKTPTVARQVRERLKQHSLLVSSGAASGSLAFDHDDFRSFYLGEAVGRALNRQQLNEVRPLLNSGLLPKAAVDEAVLHAKRMTTNIAEALTTIQQLATSESAASVVRENCGGIALGLSDGVPGVTLNGMSFPEDSLRSRTFTKLTVVNSHFQGSSLAGTRLTDCIFRACRFERIELHQDSRISATLEECHVAMLVRADRDEHYFDPSQIRRLLREAGFMLTLPANQTESPQQADPDSELRLVERVMRIFLRATQVNEAVIRVKLGVAAADFIDNVLPRLLRAGMFEEIPYLGSGHQRRFKLRIQMQTFESALSNCRGSFNAFLELISKT
jgi:hypothetical protein